MAQHQFDSIMELLVKIERNTRKEEETSAESDILARLQLDFFLKLNKKTGWGRNEIKSLFTQSREFVTASDKEKLPWRQ